MPHDAFCRRIEEDAIKGRWMCWKYYPRADWRGAELSFPTALPTKPSINQAWLGQGSCRFFETTWEKAPVSAHIMKGVSAHIMKGLQTLVVKEYKPAVITKGSSDLLISELKKLE